MNKKLLLPFERRFLKLGKNCFFLVALADLSYELCQFIAMRFMSRNPYPTMK